MPAVNITFMGMFYDKISRTYYENATMVGTAFLTDFSVGGGPIIPPPGGGGGGNGIWGPTDPRPSNPIANVPGISNPNPPGWGLRPEHPGPILPPDLPPDVTPPQVQPGDPTVPLPPPSGSGGWPVQPINPPPFIVVNYPGIGPVVVAPPAQT